MDDDNYNDYEDEEFYICKCGHEMEGDIDIDQSCPMCRRIGCWIKTEGEE